MHFEILLLPLISYLSYIFFLECQLSIVNVEFMQELSTDITKASSTITILNELVNTYKQNIPLHTVISQQDLKVFQQLNSDLIHLHQKWQTIFLWQDGPLVQAMKNGDLFLVDEISLADDSVLERLNSVLEPERKLVGIF